MDTTFIYWKEEPDQRKWKLIPDTPDDISKAIVAGAMFKTWNSFEYAPSDNGQMEPIRFGDLPLDFDDEKNPANALQELKTLCLVHLPETYGIDPNALKYFASGGKGFHSEIPAELLGAQAGDPYLPMIYKKLVTQWEESLGLKTLDKSIYAMGKGKMFRLPNVKRKNGRCKVELTLEEIRDSSIEEINKLTKAPREIDPVEVDSKPIPELVVFFTKESLLFQNKAEAPKDAKPPLTLDPVLPGERDDKLTRIVGKAIAQGMDLDMVYLAALGWRETLPDKTDFTKKDVKKIFDSITKKEARKTRLNTISAELGFELQKFKILQYPDGEKKYQLTLKGVDGSVELSTAELENQTRFRRKVIDLAQEVIPDIKRVRWFEILQSLLDQAEVEAVSIDESDVGLIYSLIAKDTRTGEMESPETFIDNQAIVFEGFIFLEMETLRKQLSMEQISLLSRSPKAIGKYLRLIGFESGGFRLNGNQGGNRWRMQLDRFKQFGKKFIREVEK